MKLLMYAVLGMAIAGNPLAQAEEVDERFTEVAYFGTGHAERAPDYGSMTITYNVACLGSDEAVRKAITALSEPLWKEIETKVEGKDDETTGPLWGPVSKLVESPGSRLEEVSDKEGHRLQRVDVCTKKVIPVDAKVPSVFSGTQTIGLRTPDMQWLEDKTKAIREIPNPTAPSEVVTKVSTIKYSITRATRTSLLNEVLKKAKDAAEGPESEYAQDVKNLRLKSATYLGASSSFPNLLPLKPGAPVSADTAPVVRADIPFNFTVFHKTRNLLDPNDTKEVGGTTSYEVRGLLSGLADYAEAQVEIKTACQATDSAATKAINSATTPVVARLDEHQKGKESTETDKIENNEAGTPEKYSPYRPVKWQKGAKENDPEKVIAYLDECKLTTVAAPKSGDVEELPPYFRASRKVILRSSDFKGIRGVVSRLKIEQGRATSDPAAVRVVISDPQGRLTVLRQQKLLLAARGSAEQCALEPEGQLALDVKERKFTCAHFRDLSIKGPAEQGGAESAEARPAAAKAMAAFDAAPGAPPIEPVVKPNSQRPVYPLTQTLAFRYRIMSANFVDSEFKATP